MAEHLSDAVDEAIGLIQEAMVDPAIAETNILHRVETDAEDEDLNAHIERVLNEMEKLRLRLSTLEMKGE